MGTTRHKAEANALVDGCNNRCTASMVAISIWRLPQRRPLIGPARVRPTWPGGAASGSRAGRVAAPGLSVWVPLLWRTMRNDVVCRPKNACRIDLQDQRVERHPTDYKIRLRGIQGLKQSPLENASQKRNSIGRCCAYYSPRHRSLGLLACLSFDDSSHLLQSRTAQPAAAGKSALPLAP